MPVHQLRSVAFGKTLWRSMSWLGGPGVTNVHAMPIEIRHHDGRVLFRSARAHDLREALAEARDARIDLAGALLEGADLRDADLARANVHGASRKTAKLMPAQLKGLVETEPERDPTSGQ